MSVRKSFRRKGNGMSLARCAPELRTLFEQTSMEISVISQQEIFEISLKLFGSIKMLSTYLDYDTDELLLYYQEKKEMPLSLYSRMHMMIEKEIDASIESFFEPDYQDFLTMKRIRKNLGFSLGDMANAIGLTGANASDLVKLMENGCVPIIGPIARLIRYMGQSAISSQRNIKDEFVVCYSLEDKIRRRVGIMANCYPRFMASVVLITEVNPMQVSVEINECEVLELKNWLDLPQDKDEHLVLSRLEKAAKYLRDESQVEKVSI